MRIDVAKYQNGGRFTSREEWIHPKRCNGSYELIVVTEGQVWIEEEQEQFVLSPGMILLLEPQRIHRGFLPSHDRVSFYWIHFEDFDLSQHPGLDKCFLLKEPYTVLMLCRQLIYSAETGYGDSALHALLHVLLGELEMQCRARHEDEDSLAVRIREWIRINSDRCLSAADISRRFGYNVDYLSRLFRKNYGHGLKAEIDLMRLREIKMLLLESDLTLSEISDRVGMGDYKLFLKFFKYHEGITPSDFRGLYNKMHTNNR